jgi:extracellular factor (EF) 3-hydroxypalmitic acid methyl ester biosynthesis protein
LGYAGDYEIVDMMLRPPHEGSTLFAKAINVWLLDQAPARAHRNRVAYLERTLVAEALRLKALGRQGRVYSLGCGPAAEVQRLLAHQPLADQFGFTLLDFNDETLAHAHATLERAKHTHGRATRIQFIKRSVQQIARENIGAVAQGSEGEYDLVYCAGLFDYLPDPVCKRLMPILYDLLAPGGLLLVTNVSDAMNGSRPFRYSMEYLLDWHLIYRDGAQLAALAPEAAPRDRVAVLGEESGVNLFLEVRKPDHG